jgi:hypothetical protein
MPLAKKGSVLNKSQDGAAPGKNGGAWKKKQRKTKSAEVGSSIKYLDSDPPSPCAVCKKMVDEEGINCNRCSAWSHSHCSELPPTVFDFLVNTHVEAIKWFCPTCEKDSGRKDPNDKLAEQLAKLETLTAVVLTLQQQNVSILEMLKSERSIEEKVKVQVTEVLDSQKEKEGRVNNIVVFNISESLGTGQEAENTHDKKEICNILAAVRPDLDPLTVEVEKVTRLGRRKDPKSNPRPRPIKVVFKDHDVRNSILRKAWRLKDHEQLKKVGISADKTLTERNAEKAVRQEFLRRREMGEEVVMYKGRVMTKGEKETSKRGESDLREGGFVSQHVGKEGGVPDVKEKPKV